MHLSKPFLRAAGAVLSVIATITATLLVAAPSQADTRVMPGSFTGYAFDTCWTPTQSQMDVWRERSPYSGIGIYIAGVNRYCQPQTLLTPEWVSTQSAKGWRLLPLTVGRQAPCSTRDRYRAQPKLRLISNDPSHNYRTARRQGRAEASDTVATARYLGIAQRSTLWFDLEHFDVSNQVCRDASMAFLSGWSWKLHRLGYRSGIYSSASSGMRMLDEARLYQPNRYTLPDQIWIAEWMHGVQPRRAHRSAGVDSAYVSEDGWMPHARVRQYLGGHHESYGGVEINIDSDFMDVGRGSFARPEGPHCGVRINFPRYRLQRLGRSNDQVAAGQCLLRRKHVYDGRAHGRFDRRTLRAVKRFQRRHELPVTGVLNRRTWTVLLADGQRPLMKFGSNRYGVRRVQRALNAAEWAELEVSGVFDRPTVAAVRAYQRARGLHRTGVVTEEVWQDLQRGRR
ncbi:MAG TPA: glycoside hydrolase domain-containing protein [Nocardioidaceae bacterium]|jgi:hypothetical protein